MRGFIVVVVCAVGALVSMVPGAAGYELAFALANKQNAASYEPNTDFSSNAGMAITVEKTGNGRYDVQFGRVANAGAHVQVTMYGTSLGYCNVEGWGFGSAQVRCFNRQGNPANRKFAILALSGCGPESEFLSYAWLNQPNLDNYVSHPAWRFGSGTYNVERTNMGRWSVDLGAPAHVNAVVLASGHGSNKLCSVRGWGVTEAAVACRNAGLSFADSRSNVMAIKAGFPHASFAWNNELNGNLSNLYSYASDDSEQKVVRTQKGRYTVTLGPEASTKGNVQVVTYNSDANCWIANWGNGKAFVRCTKFVNFVDAKFVVLAIS